MKIKPIVRKRELTNFNAKSSTKRGKKVKHYAIMMYVYDRGKIYYINTGLTTSNVRMQSSVFTDEELTATENSIKTARLTKMWNRAEDYAMDNLHLSVDALKNELVRIIQGVDRETQVKEREEKRKRKGLKPLHVCVSRFAASKERKGTTLNYMWTARKLEEYAPDATYADVDLAWLETWEIAMKRDGLSVNSISIQMRNLKATINNAIKHGETDCNAFKLFSIKQQRVEHLVLTAQEIADFRDYPVEPWQEVYKDIAMLTFYLAGVNTGDLLLLKRLQKGRLVYDRQKTHQHADIIVCKEAMDIINKYKGKEYLLSMMDGRADYHSFLQKMDKALKKMGIYRIVADKVGAKRQREYHPMFEELTTYTFRRSFASIASNELDISKETIGQCLTHSWTDVTEIYIKRSTKKADECVMKVVELVSSLKGRSKEEIDAEIMERDGLTE